MALFCKNCNRDTGTIPCEHCGSLLDVAFELTAKLSDEDAKKLERLLPKFDVSRFIGVPCATCGELFTQGFFDAGGTIIRTSDDRWQHDHCLSQN
jgi:hypothetical protein